MLPELSWGVLKVWSLYFECLIYSRVYSVTFCSKGLCSFESLKFSFWSEIANGLRPVFLTTMD